MAAIINDRDLILQGALIRLSTATNESLSITTNATAGFEVTNGNPLQTSIILTATKSGFLSNAGPVTFAAVSGYVGTLDQNGTTCTVEYQGLVDAVSNSCVISASVTYLGTTYTTNVLINGISIVPSSIQNIASNVFNTNIRLTWDKNTEIDLGGYEIRTADSGWGDDLAVYHGNTNSAILPAYPTATTYYIKSYNNSGLYSTTSTEYTFTPDPVDVITNTNISISINNASDLNTLLTISWPAVESQFKIDRYLIRIVKYGNIIEEYESLTTTLDVEAWVMSSADITIAYKTIIGQESLYSSIKSYTLPVPTAPSLPTIGTTGNKINIAWTKSETTGLPINRYEIRTVNSNWGSKVVPPLLVTNSIDITIPPSNLNLLVTYYIVAFDTVGNYSTPISISYTVLPPSTVEGLGYEFITTVDGLGICRLYWEIPTITSFELKHFKVTLTRPDTSFREAYILSSEWQVPADWVGIGIFKILLIDTNNAISSLSTLNNITIVAPSAPVLTSKVVSYPDTNVKVVWPAAVPNTFAISGYEIRTTNSTINDTNLISKNNSPTLLLSRNQYTPEAQNTYYVYSYDINGIRSTSSALSFTLTKPPIVTEPELFSKFSNNKVGQSIVTIYWDIPTNNTFSIAYYKIKIVKPGFPDVEVTSISNFTELIADWEGVATIYITTYDILGSSSTVFEKTVTKVAPTNITLGTVSHSIDVSINTSDIVLTWSAPINTGSLPIVGYVLFDNANNVLGETTSLSISITRSQYIIGNNTFKLKAKDSAGKLSTNYISYTGIVLATPGVPVAVSAKFNDTTAIFRWQEPVGHSFKIVEYILSLEGSFTTISERRNTTDWEVNVPSNWGGLGRLFIKAVDAAGSESSPIETLEMGLTLQVPSQPAVVNPGFPIIHDTSIEVDWNDNPNADTQLAIKEYRIYNDDSPTPQLVWKGSVSLAKFDLPKEFVGTITYKIEALDTNSNVCITPRTFTYEIVKPVAPTINELNKYKFGTDTSNSALSLFWNQPTTEYGISGYQVSYDSETIFIKSNTVIINPIPSGWLGAKTFNIRTIDQLLNISDPIAIIVEKSAPNPILESDYRIEVVDNNVLLYWVLPAITTLPIAGTRIRKLSEFGDISIGDKTGTFTSVFERRGGFYSYELSTVDSDGYTSSAIVKQTQVSEPPDFIFVAAQTSTFTGTKFKAISTLEGTLVLPVNDTSTWSQHFTVSDGLGAWGSPQDQISNVPSYPIYIQPTETTGYYEEVFNFGNVVSSSKVSINLTGTAVAGSPQVTVSIATSEDGITWSTSVISTSLFATVFQYVKTRITVTTVTPGIDLYSISNLEVVLDSKKISDSYISNVYSSDTDGTVVNFAKEFIDLSSINLTILSPDTYPPVYVVADSSGEPLAATYQITSNICTVNTTVSGFEHGLKPGQKVKLNFTTGGAVNVDAIYTVLTSSTAYIYTVSLSIANTSGNVYMFSQSMRLFLYNDVGSRINGSISWLVTGY